MKLFPDNFVQNADKAINAIDGFLKKYQELGKTSTNLDTANADLKKYKANLEEAETKLKSFGNITTTKQAWKEQARQVESYGQSLDAVIKKSAEVNASKKTPKTTNNEDYNNLTKLIQLQNEYNRVVDEGKQLRGTAGAKTNAVKNAVAEQLQAENISVQKLQRSYAGLRSAETSISQRMASTETNSEKWEQLKASLESVRTKILVTKLAMNQLQKDAVSQELTQSFGLTKFTDTSFSKAAQQFISSARAQLQQLRAEGQNLDILNPQDLAEFDKLIQKIDEATTRAHDFDDALQKKNEASSMVDEKTKEVEKLQKAFDNFDSKGKIDKLFSDLEKLGISTDGIEKSAEGVQQLKENLLGVNSDGVKKLNDEFGKTKTQVQASENAINKIRNSLGDLGQATTSLQQMNSEFEQLKSQAQYFFGLTNSFNLLKRAIRGAYETVKKLDAAMTETAVVTDFSVGDMWEQLPQYTTMAKKLGATTEGAYRTAALYYQQGLDTAEAMQLSTETMKMARVAGMEYATATKAMTSALRGFNMELNDMSAQRVNDVYSELAKITATDTQQLATAMTKTASIAYSANMEFENVSAFLAQILETTQEAPETAGTALKTIIGRFTEVKKLYSSNQLIGKDSEGEEIQVNKVSQALSAAGINLNEFFTGAKGLDDILYELSQRWDTLDVTVQRYIATQAAGSRQQSRFIALMQNNARLTELMNAAKNSKGSAEGQFEKTLDSLEAKVNKLRDAWEEFLMGIANSDLIKGSIDLLTKLLEVINKLTKGTGGLDSALMKLAVVGTALQLGGGLLQGGLGYFNARRYAVQAKGMAKAGVDPNTIKAVSNGFTGDENIGSFTSYLGGGLANFGNLGFVGLTKDLVKSLFTNLKGIFTNSNVLSDAAGKELITSMAANFVQNTKGKVTQSAITKQITEGLAYTKGAGIWTQFISGAKTGNELVDVGVALEAVGTKAGGAATGMAKFGAVVGALSPVLIPLVAILGTLVAMGLAAYFTSAEYKLKKLNKEIEKTDNLLKDVQSEQNELTSFSQNFNQLTEKMEDLQVGTYEWNQALIESNKLALELIEKYSQLKYTIDSTGRIIIDEDSLEALQNGLQKMALDTQVVKQNLIRAKQQLGIQESLRKSDKVQQKKSTSSDMEHENEKAQRRAIGAAGNSALGRSSEYIAQQNGISLSMEEEYQKFLQDSSTDFLGFLEAKYQESSANWDQIEKQALHWFSLKQEEIAINQSSQISAAEAYLSRAGSAGNIMIAGNEKATKDKKQEILGSALGVSIKTTDIDFSDNAKIKENAQRLLDDVLGEDIKLPEFWNKDQGSLEKMWREILNLGEIPDYMYDENGQLIADKLYNAIIANLIDRQYNVGEEIMKQVLASQEGADRWFSGDLTKADLEKGPIKLTDKQAQALNYENYEDYKSKVLDPIAKAAELNFASAEATYKSLTNESLDSDSIGKDLGATAAKAYTDILEQAYVRQGNLGINNIQGFITGIAGNDSEKITQVIQALSQVNDLGDTDQIESLFKSLEALGLFAGKSRKEIQNLKNSFISVNNAIKKLDFDQLKEKISSIGQIVNKINLGEQDNIFSKEDMDLITGLNPDLENDFYMNLDGSFTYLGGSMDNLAAALGANTSALLNENLDQAKIGMTLASAWENSSFKPIGEGADKRDWLNYAKETIATWPDGKEILNFLGMSVGTDYSKVSEETAEQLYGKLFNYNGANDYYEELYRANRIQLNGLNLQTKSAWDLYNIGQDKTLGGYIKNDVVLNADEAKAYASTYLNALIAKNKDYGTPYGSTLQSLAQQAQNVNWSDANQVLSFMGQAVNTAQQIAQKYGEIRGTELYNQVNTSKDIINDKNAAPNNQQAQYGEVANVASKYYGAAISADFVEKYWDQFLEIGKGGEAAEIAASAIRGILQQAGVLVENEVKAGDFKNELDQEIEDIQENGTKPVVSVDGDTTELENKTNEATSNINGQGANINVGVNTEEAEEGIKNLTAKELFTNLEVSLDGADTAEEKIKALAQWISNLTDTPLSFTITGQANLTDIVTKFSDLMTQISELVTAVNDMSSGVMTTAAEIEGRFEQLAATLSLVTEIVDEPDAQVTYTGVSTTALPNGDVIAGPGNQYIMKVPQFKVNVKKNENAGNDSSGGSSGGSKDGSSSGSKGGSSSGSYTPKKHGVSKISSTPKPTEKNKPKFEDDQLAIKEAQKEVSSTITPSKGANETNPNQGPTDTDIAKAPTTPSGPSRDNNFTNPKDVGNFGKNKGTGSGSGSGSKDSPSSSDEDKWENSYDWLYNLTQDINAELEKREKLELKYNNILKDRNKTAKELYQNAKAQLASLEKSRSLNSEAYEKRKAELQLEAKQATAQYTNDTRFNMKWGTGLASGSGSSSGLRVINLAGSGGGSESTKKDQGKRTMLSEAELGRYATFNWDDNTVEINWDAVNQITDQQKGEAVEDYISKLEEIQEKMNEAEKSLLEIDGKIREIIDQGKDEFQDFEQQIFDALVSRYQKEIDKLTEISEAITDANSKLIDSMTNAIDKEREARDNEKTETELADKQKRLDYLRSDTSNANAKQILDLEKELAEGQEDYTDQLIDQKIDELKEQNDKASEQRQVQIDLMTKNLEMAQETGALWQEVYNLMDVGVDQEGALVKQSELFDLLQSEAGWQGMSAVSKMTWLDELTETVKAGMAYLMTGRQLEYIGAEAGKQITFSAYDEQGKLQWLTGTVDKNGDVVDSNGVRYSEIFQNYDGSFTTMETAGVGTKKEPPKPEAKPSAPSYSGGTNTTSSNSSGTVWKIGGYNGVILNSDGSNSGVSVWDVSMGVSNAEVRALRDVSGDLSRYDDNEDGYLDKKELGAVWKDNPDINPKDSKYLEKYDKIWDPYYKKYPSTKYKTGGLNTQTGPAWLDGTFAKPELVLNSKDTANFLELRDLLRALQISIKSPHRDLTDNNKNNGDNYYEIDINVESIADDYDVAKMADKIKKLISQDALYRNGNAINRLR